MTCTMTISVMRPPTIHTTTEEAEEAGAIEKVVIEEGTKTVTEADTKTVTEVGIKTTSEEDTRMASTEVEAADTTLRASSKRTPTITFRKSLKTISFK